MDAEDFYRCFALGIETELSLSTFACQNQVGSGRFVEQARGVAGFPHSKRKSADHPGLNRC